jgi:hypothetical protein
LQDYIATTILTALIVQNQSFSLKVNPKIKQKRDIFKTISERKNRSETYSQFNYTWQGEQF